MEDIAPFAIGFGMVVVLPIVGMLLSHQRKMAELIHKRQGHDAGVDSRLERMQSQIEEMRTLLYDHTIRMDDQRELIRKSSPPAPPQSDEIIRRLG